MCQLPYSLESILEQVIKISLVAGEAIMNIYQSENFAVEIKGDDSPLTRADIAAHHIIVNHLERHFPKIPCLSEESETISFSERSKWPYCFVIDPLDGTKEFIAGNDEFTVNLALVENGRSRLGVIFAPVLKTIYYAAEGLGAFKQIGDAKPKRIQVSALTEINGHKHFCVVASRRHGIDAVEKLCQNFSSYDLTTSGSSLKMCLIAEGKADFYPRLAPTSEWDTAAAQAIVEQAGGQLVQVDFTSMTYNKKESLLNPYFLVLGDPEFDWQKNLIIPNDLG